MVKDVCLEICAILFIMVAKPHIWRGWASFLHRWGLHQLVASWLELAGPLNILGAQLIYLSQPFLSVFIHQDALKDLAQVLEQPEEVKKLVHFLRNEDPLVEDGQ